MWDHVLIEKMSLQVMIPLDNSKIISSGPGEEPPAWAKKMMADINVLQSAPAGSDAFNQAGARMVQNMTKELLFIGTVNAPAPMIHRNNLINFTETKTHSYEYYRTYPYRATQWWLDE